MKNTPIAIPQKPMVVKHGRNTLGIIRCRCILPAIARRSWFGLVRMVARTHDEQDRSGSRVCDLEFEKHAYPFLRPIRITFCALSSGDIRKSRAMSTPE